VTALGSVASAVKSANAGASMLTLDMTFATAATLQAVIDNGLLSASSIASCYAVDPEAVQLFVCWPVLAIKVTIPRREPSGGRGETDFDGTQQFIPLLGLEVGEESLVPSTPLTYSRTDRALAQEPEDP
jgi:hypothetical protein